MLEGKRIVLGVSGGIAAYKAVEVCRRLVDAGRPRRARPHRGRAALRRPHHLRRPRLRAGVDVALGRAPPDPAHPPRPDRRPRARRAGHRPGPRPLRRRASATTCSPTSCSPPGRRCSCARPCTPRCGSTPPCRTTCGCCARAASTSSSPRAAAWPAATSAPAAWPTPRRSSRAVDALLAAEHEHDLTGLRVVVTAGGTREPIDPVRFIGNRSSGKQGHAVAEEAAAPRRQGHPRHHRRRSRPPPASTSCRVDTAAEMEHAVLSRADDADVVVMAAAVADFRPVDAAGAKIKKADGVPAGGARAHHRHPRRPRRAAAPRPDDRRLRGRDRRPARQRRRQARPQGRSTSSWPTTCRPRASGSSTTPTPW